MIAHSNQELFKLKVGAIFDGTDHQGNVIEKIIGPSEHLKQSNVNLRWIYFRRSISFRHHEIFDEITGSCHQLMLIFHVLQSKRQSGAISDEYDHLSFEEIFRVYIVCAS